MVDQKLTQLTEDTSPTTDDLIYVVNDPVGTPASKKVALSNLKNLLVSDVVARYSTDAGQSFTSAAADTIVDFEDQTYDTHTAVTIGASWKFTCPAGQGGYYQVNANILFNGTSAWADVERGLLSLYKNGALFSRLDRRDNNPANTLMMLSGNDIVQLDAADYIDIRLTQNSGSALTLATTGNFMSIAKIKG